MFACAVCAAVQGQVATSGTAVQKSAAPGSPATTYTIVLVGETPGGTGAKGKKQHADIMEITTRTLGGRVHDFTSAGQTLETALKGMQPVLAARPQVAIVFGGAADEKAGTPDEQQQYSVKAIITSLKGAGARIYLVPSSPALATMTGANLRLAAEPQATFIETGSDIAGRPYEDALEAIALAEQNPKAAATPTPAPSPVATETPRPKPQGTRAPGTSTELQTSMPSLETTGGTAVSPTPAEKPHGVFSAPTPAKAEDLISRPTPKPVKEEEETTTPRLVTKRGSDAQATINMRPPPALKNFSPQKPVPRKDTDKKAPDVAR
jgi:hypothetical protein